MKFIFNKKILILFTALVLIAFFGKTVFAVWNNTFYNPGDTLDPECLPTDVDCDVLIPVGHDAVTLGTANGLSLSTQVLSLALASTSTTGALSNTDWNTFNNKASSTAFTLAGVSALSTDATKSLYTMTSTIPVEFKTSGGTTALKITEASGLVTVASITSPGTGTASERFGAGATANQSYSTAVGNSAEGTGGQGATGLGYSARAQAQFGVAIGFNSLVAGNEGVAIGGGSVVGATGYGVSIGRATETGGVGSSGVAIGYYAKANYGLSIALGSLATTTAAKQMVIGGGSSASGYGIDTVYIGSGVTDAVPLSFSLNATGGSGTDIAGANLTLASGKGTGNALGGSIFFQTSDAGSTGTTLQSLTTKMTILPNGNVGIGTTAPTSKLTVVSSAANTDVFAFKATNGNPIMILMDNSSNGNAVFDLYKNAESGVTGVGARISTDVNFPSYFNVGNVGIGTTAPAAKLQISGTTFLNGGLDVGDTAYYDGSVAFSLKSNRTYLFNMYDASANPKLWLTQTGHLSINTATSGTNGILTVNTPSTTDNLATAQISTAAATNKGLVVQGYTSQSANLQEWQNSSGTVLAKVTSSGVITANSSDGLWGTYITASTSAIGYLGFNSVNYLSMASSILSIPVLTKIGTNNSANGLVINMGSLSASGVSGYTDNRNLTAYFSAPDGHTNQSIGQQAGGFYFSLGTGGYASTGSNGNGGNAGNFTIQLAKGGVKDGSGTNGTDSTFIVKGAASQANNITEWQTSDGTVQSRISSAGDLYLGTSRSVNVGSGSWSAGTLNISSGTNLGTLALGGSTVLSTTNSPLTLTINSAGFTNVVIPNGNVGIGGVTTPDFKLDIAGASLANLLKVNDANGYGMYVSTGNTLNTNYGINADSAFWINYYGYNNGATQFRDLTIGNGKTAAIAYFDGSTGNVGIGTIAPVTKLEAFGTANATLTTFTQNIANNVLSISNAYVTGYNPGLMWYTTDNNPTKPKAGIWTENGAAGSSLYFGTTSSYATGINNQAITINPSGNVGIGTTAPTDLLTINTTANGQWGSLQYANTEYIKFGSGNIGYGMFAGSVYAANEGNGFGINAGSPFINGGLNIGTGSASFVTYNVGTNTTPVLTIPSVGLTTKPGILIGMTAGQTASPFEIQDSTAASVFKVTGGGNVGIGTTAPGAKLEISGVAASGILRVNGGDGNNLFTSAQIAFGYNTTSQYSSYIHTRHNSVAAGNAIDFYTGDGTANGVFPTNAIFGMTINNGSVGIGTTAPTEKLEIGGILRTTGRLQIVGDTLPASRGGLEMAYASTGDGGTGWGSTEVYAPNSTSPRPWVMVAKDVRYYVGASSPVEKVRIDSSGNFGIGTTAPASKLHVYGTGTTLSGTANYLTYIQSDISDNPGVILGYDTAGGGVIAAGTVASGQPLNFWTYNGSAWGERMRISKEGNVGIGTTAPTSLLALGGTAARTIQMERNTTAATAGQGLTLSSGGAIAGTADLAGGDLTLKSGISTGSGSSSIHFYTATAGASATTDRTPTEKMIILGSGNVGIGTTTPAEKLSVTGNMNFTSSSTISSGSAFDISGATLNINAGVGSVTGGNLYLAGGDGLTDGDTIIGHNGSAAIGFVGIGMTDPSVALDVTGDIEYTGTITDVSDMRLKENIQDFNNGLNIIKGVTVKTFNMIGSTKNETGFIAQNIKEIFPEAVSIVDPANGYMGVSYVSFIPVLTQAVQELNTNLESLTLPLTEENNTQTFTERFFGKLAVWLGEAGNGIINLYASVLHSDKVDTKELCLEDICVTKDQLQMLLQNANMSPSPVSPAEGGAPTPDPVPTTSPDEPAPLSDQGGSGNSEPTPVPTSDPVVVPAPDSTSSPQADQVVVTDPIPVVEAPTLDPVVSPEIVP